MGSGSGSGAGAGLGGSGDLERPFFNWMAFKLIFSSSGFFGGYIGQNFTTI